MTLPIESGPGAGVRRTLVADGHVHIYRNFDLEEVFDAAVANLAGLARAAELDPALVDYALLLGDTWGDRAFDRIATGVLPGGWYITRSGERALSIRRKDDRFTIIAGRQLVTSERLEVQAIGTNASIPDGLSIWEAIAAVREAGAFPVVPWGFGKWWGQRGDLVRQVIEREKQMEVGLGDNGGRMGLAGRPPLLAYAEQRGMNVIAGSDPLPFPEQAKRIGTFGFLLQDWAADLEPGAQIQSRLAQGHSRPVIAGRTTGPVGFVLAQTRMQLANRRFRGMSR